MPLPKKRPAASKAPKPLIEKTLKQDFASVIKENLEQTRHFKLVPKIEELESASTGSLIGLVDTLIQKAYQSGTSDIHIDPAPKGVVIRFRIDGVLHDVIFLEKDLQPLIITRLKVLSGLRTDEHLMAQDGGFRIKNETQEIELRVSIVPTFNGENAVIRLLVGGAQALGLEQLGFTDPDLETIKRYIKKPHGMILATGPTGSGKTTTLYSILHVLNSRDISIVTIEDPIEYAVTGITQLQVNTLTNFTFGTGLRSIVRQDPNIIMVGEIRDRETASIAVNAAMTGHLLLSTLHTTDAATTLPRLLDMGIEPFLIASTVNLIIGQRLVRRLCESCRVSAPLSEEERIALAPGLPKETLEAANTFWHPKGCEACSQTGYTKRVGIYEILEVTESLRSLIMRRANADDAAEAAKKEGMKTMLEDGFLKASQGVTSIAEIIRVIND